MLRTAQVSCLVLTWVLWVSAAACETVRFPLTLDMPLLRALIVQQAYPGTGEQAVIVNLSQGCNRIVLSSPQVKEEKGLLRLQTKVRINWGTPVVDSCLAPLSWEGSVILWQRPRISPQWQLSFEIVNSAVVDKEGRPIKLVAVLWNLVKEHVHNYLNKISINLAPPVSDMKATLLPMFDRDHQNSARDFLASMRPDRPALQPDGIKVDILAEITTAPRQEEGAPVPQPTTQEYTKVIQLWHAWDAFLVYQLKQFTDKPLSPEDRRTLLNTMLTVRYEFTTAIEQQTVTNEFIRRQFLWGWNQLKPVFQRHLHVRPSNNLLGYLAFFTASDALAVLDRLGPSIGIEISADGFRRLAALIGTEPLDQGPAASEADPKLRKSLGLEPLEEPPLETDKPLPVPAFEESEPTSWLNPLRWPLLQSLFSPSTAWAADSRQAPATDIQDWTAELTPAASLLPKVRDVLRSAASRQKREVKVPGGDSEWFDTMILATAWQESCFRQFHIKNKTVTYLLSYNNTSVGVMQVNEQIWRGVYNIQQLRWNIQYNAQAGSEILALYLRDYIVNTKAPLDLSTAKGQRFMATWLYALYNGGPSQRKPFLDRYAANKLYRSEELFLAKLDQVKESEWFDRVRCLP